MTEMRIEAMPLPKFESINPQRIGAELDTVLGICRAQLALISHQAKEPTWDTCVQPLEEMEAFLSHFWSPISHLNSVSHSDALRSAYEACLPKLSDFYTELGQSKPLYDAFKVIQDSADYQDFSQAKRAVIEHALRDFHLSGVDLAPKNQARFAEIKKRLSELGNQFNNHVLDATKAWSLSITDEVQLAGLPESSRALLKQTAQQRGQEGWLITLGFPSYYAVMTYADDRDLRAKVYEAYTTRASEKGPHAGQFDNSVLMQEMLALRLELAKLLGFNDYAEYSLATKMAESPKEVMRFLEALAQKSYRQAQEEVLDLTAFATNVGLKGALQAWDTAYYSEKLRQKRYAISQEELRPYFPEDQVLQGLYRIIHRLYGYWVKETVPDSTWHPDVRLINLYDEHQELQAQCYIDLYARENKRGGAWMDECRIRTLFQDGQLQLPVAYLTCNFNPPIGNDPALFTHDEVVTLFHEMGHCLHHMLTQMVYPSVSGINGVAWDAVECPSQFFEHWSWDPEGLALIARHYKTGDALPEVTIERLLKAKNFQSAMQMMRQLEFALFDFKIHQIDEAISASEIQSILNDVRKKVAVVPVPDFNRFQHSFGHIFGGGYAAGYYSYKWAEVLASDAFSRFEEEGIFNETVGRAFLNTFLTQGGSQDAMILFKAFRGRAPSEESLLRHCGIIDGGSRGG